MGKNKKQATTGEPGTPDGDRPHPIEQVQRTFVLEDLIQADETGNQLLVWDLVTLLLAARSRLPEDLPLAALVEIDVLYAFMDDAFAQGVWRCPPHAMPKPGQMVPALKVQARRIEEALEGSKYCVVGGSVGDPIQDPETDTQHTGGRGKSKPISDPVAVALGLLVITPARSVTSIAAEVGIDRRRLYEHAGFRQARQVLRQEREKRIRSIPKGSKDNEGNLEAMSE